MSLALLIAYLYSYIKQTYSTTFVSSSEEPPTFNTLLPRMHLGLGGRRQPKTESQSKLHLPPPDPWRDGLPVLYQEPICPAWPHNLFPFGCAATIVIAMWFYNLHLKLFGHTFLNWWTSCRKGLLPRFSWQELLLPYRLLPRWTITNPYGKLQAFWAELPTINLYLRWLFFRDSYHSLPTTPPVKKTKPKSAPPPPPLS